MLTTFHKGHWIPVTWLSFGADFLVWGMEPKGRQRGTRLPSRPAPAREDGRGRHEEAIAQFSHALRINPGLAHAQHNWGIALARQGKWQEAVEHYEEALRLSPDYPEAHLNLAAALQRLGRYADAQRHVDRARSTLLPPGR